MKNILGTVTIPKENEDIKEWLRGAHSIGIDWLDTAWVYQSGNCERILGRAMKELKDEEDIEFKVQTKIWTSHYEDVKNRFKEQLNSLEMTRVDSLLLHRPSHNLHVDVKAWRALIELKAEGLVDHIGVSNYEQEMITFLEKETGVRPEINQIELSVSNFREDRVFANNKLGIEIQAWSIFGNDVKANLKDSMVKKIANDHGVVEATILSSFISSQGITPLHGSSKINHMKESVDVIELNEAEIELLKSLNKFDNKYEVSYPLKY